MLNGVFLIDKDCQMTSRSLDNRIGKKFGVRKVGHVGTLDPLATGLMLVAVNEGTKAIPYIENSTKEYVATFKLGMLTTTLDLEGEVVKQVEVSEFSSKYLKQVIEEFIGEITQIPPLTSAIKIDGVPLYKYAHKNINVDVPPRNVVVHEIELLAYNHPEFTIRTLVSSGTYIRTLGNDIAHRLLTFATTTNLRRTKIANFNVEMAKKLENVGENDIMKIDDFLNHLPSADITQKQLRLVQVGAHIQLKNLGDTVKIVYQGKLLAIYQKIEEQTYKCLRGFNL